MRVILALACVACVGHAKQVRLPGVQVQSISRAGSEAPPKAKKLKALATFLLASDSAGAFHPSCRQPGFHWGVSPVAESRQQRNCLPHVVMQQVQKQEKKGFDSLQKTKRTFFSGGGKSYVDSYLEFTKWAENLGAKACKKLLVADFGGERGLAAGEMIAAGAQILTVPSVATFQVTALSPCPEWCPEASWTKSKWDAKLAIRLLHEDADPESPWRPWLDELPREYCMPCLKPNLLKALENLGFTKLCKDVRQMRTEWDTALKGMPEGTTAEQFDWAMATVRSRSFTGKYNPGTFGGTMKALFLIATLCLAWGTIVGGAGARETAYNVLLTSFVAFFSNDIIIGPRITQAKRHVLCPWIDFINHNGNYGGAEFSYEYFKDAFSANLDPKAGPVKQGDQVYISYGPRSNDRLLQYYGFVQRSNPHDVFTIDQENIILDVDSILPSGLPEGALDTLKSAGLGDSKKAAELNEKGADELALQVTRILTHPELAKGADNGLKPLEANAEAAALRTLASVAKAREGSLRSSLAAATRKLDGDEASLLESFVKEKRKVLLASAEALEKQAAKSSA